MNKAVSLLAGISLFFSSGLGFLTGNTPKHTICLDPGHGGDDPGAITNNLSEADLTLRIAKKLESLLKDKGFTVVLTRENMQTSLSNSQRADICNAYNADVALSIHLNSSTDSSTDYTQGLYGTKEKDKNLADIMHNSLQAELHVSSPPNDDPVTDFQDNFMLRTTMPATLQETVFISSADEHDSLVSGEREDEIARALYDGIVKWFSMKK